MVLDVVVIVLFLFYAIIQFVGKNKVKQSQSDMEDLLKEGLYQLERNQNIVASNVSIHDRGISVATKLSFSNFA